MSIYIYAAVPINTVYTIIIIYINMCGKWKRKRRNFVFPWSANDKRSSTFAVSANVLYAVVSCLKGTLA
jgi:hypothetical protein